MVTNVNLRKTISGWAFASELVLEDFVWTNISYLFGLTPLKRQHPAKGEFCDILAVDGEQRLFVLELKNTEDRYVVQQLTRYYDNLLDKKPFNESVNYEIPVKLIAVAPTFHRHNFIDKKYNRLSLNFYTFEVIELVNGFNFILKNVDTEEKTSLEIPYQPINITELIKDLPSPPQILIDALGSWNSEEQQSILAIRNKILSFDKRMQEIVTAKSISYGRSQAKVCAEFLFSKNQRNPTLFLWLPLDRRSDKPAIGRHRIWTDWTKVLYIGHVIEGLGQRKPQLEWDNIPKEKHPRKCLSMHRFIADIFHPYIARRMGYEDDSCSLKLLIDLALSKWQERL